MKVLVAPDKFKGSMSALVAAQAIARGWGQGWPECAVELAPMADGGEGFVEIFQTALGGEWVEREVQDPLGRPVRARYVWVEASGLAVLGMSEASGFWRLRPEERAPLQAHTFGTGQLLRDAVERGARRILIGLGGSATTDAATGLAAALGYRFLDARGAELPPGPGELPRLHRIEREGALPLPEVIGACDVSNPLLGPSGTARIFAPQKGATPEQVERLEAGLAHLAAIARRDLGAEWGETPGAGAAGGFGWGLLTFCGATLQSGFELVAETMGLAERVRSCDLVVTGEGQLDAQTLAGKGPAGLLRLARRAGRPVLGLAGAVQPEAERAFTVAVPIVDRPLTLAEAMSEGAGCLERTAARAARLLRLGSQLPGTPPGEA